MQPARFSHLHLVVSGQTELWSVTSDEAFVLRDYQAIRDAGRGALYVEFVNGAATKYEVKHGGGVAVFNTLLTGTWKLRE